MTLFVNSISTGGTGEDMLWRRTRKSRTPSKRQVWARRRRNWGNRFSVNTHQFVDGRRIIGDAVGHGPKVANVVSVGTRQLLGRES